MNTKFLRSRQLEILEQDGIIKNLKRRVPHYLEDEEGIVYQYIVEFQYERDGQLFLEEIRRTVESDNPVFQHKRYLFLKAIDEGMIDGILVLI